MADSEVEVKSKGHKRVIEKGKERRKNCKDRKIELLIALYEVRACLWDVAHEEAPASSKTT